MFDPVRRAEQIAGIICQGESRKYRRFRPARCYGGIATADCVGCNLQCIFCWSYDSVMKPHTYWELYSPEEVARKLAGIAGKKGYRQVRISGGEPTLSKDHLLKVLDDFPRDFRFIPETNGILIGHDFQGCQGCFLCKTKLDRCAVNDDLTPVLDLMREADVVVLSSPVYYWDVSGQVKCFLDRSFSFLEPDFSDQPQTLAASIR